MTSRDTPFNDTRGRSEAAYDMGLRRHMLQVYNYMASGVLLTGIVALLFAESGMAAKVFTPNGGATILGWMIMLAPLAYIFFLNNRLRTGSLRAGQIAFWSFTAIMGLSMSTIFLVYTATSIATTFFACSAAFAGLSLYGYTTKRNLGPIGAFLIMAVWGLIVASLINLFVHSSGMNYIISAAGIVIFAGLTAYDTQKIKSEYRQGVSADVNERLAIWGAMELYLDFINLMMHLLKFMGAKKE